MRENRVWLVMEDPYHDNGRPLAAFHSPWGLAAFVRGLKSDVSVWRIDGQEVVLLYGGWPEAVCDTLDELEALLTASKLYKEAAGVTEGESE